MEQPTIRLRAQCNYMHKGRKLLINEEYDCEASEALDLIAMRKAVRVEEEARTRRAYKRRDLESEPGL